MTSALIDAAGRSTQEINARIRELIDAGETEIEVLNPGARHNLAVGILQRAHIIFRGDVGYFCGALSDGLEIEVEGDAGWSLGADQMDGTILVHGSAGASTAASVRGGLIVVWGDAGARTAISLKGGTVIIGGSTGYMSGFMAQQGRLVVCGDAGDAFGDSMYLGELFCGGDVTDLGSDTVLDEPDDNEIGWLEDTLAPFDLAPKHSWKRVRSGRKLWHYDKKEFALWKEAL